MSNVREHDTTRPNLPRRLGISLATLALLGAGAVSATQAFAGTGDAGAGAVASGTVKVQTATNAKGKATKGKATKGKATKGKATKGKAKAGKADDGRGHDEPFPAAGEALQAAVSAALPGGTITDVHGVRIPGDEHSPETVGAYLDLAPSAGAPAGGVSVFHLTSGWWGSITAQEYVELCPDEVDDCQVTTLPDGTVVKSYSQVGVDTPTGPWTLYRVERLVDGVVIGLNAYAARAEDEEGSVLAANPPLTMEQLVDVAAHLQPLR